MEQEIITQIAFIQSELAKTKQPIVVVGLMGAGKTMVGNALAEALGVKFKDSDDLIVERHGAITDIFESKGEATFRDMERSAILDLLKGGAKVLSTGGGAFMQEETRDLIQQKAVSIWLNAGIDTLYERVKDTTNRPLLEGGDKRAKLQSLIDVRYSIYAHADIHVVVGDEGTSTILESIEQNRDRVINALYRHLNR